MPAVNGPQWDVWYNRRREGFCEGQTVAITDVLAEYYNMDKAKIYRAIKDYECMGCNQEILRGDLYGRTRNGAWGELPLCLNCVTTQPGVRGTVPEPLDKALQRYHNRELNRWISARG